MKPLIAACAILAAMGGWADTPDQAMKKGRTLYSQERFDEAATNFSAAARTADDRKLDPAFAKFNEATALLKSGKAADAAQLYGLALRSPDLRLQEQSYFNRGNALAAISREQEAQQQLDKAVEAMGEALHMYESAMALDPRDMDPKFNFELALKRKQALEELLQQQQQRQQDQDDKKKDEKDKEQKKQENEQEEEKKEQEKEKEKEGEEQGQRQEEQQSQQAEPRKPEEMTPEEARLLLDAAKQQEQADREQIRWIMGRPVPVEKDW
jgi:tetratricopeptide (TPR) repeat protein